MMFVIIGIFVIGVTAEVLSPGSWDRFDERWMPKENPKGSYFVDDDTLYEMTKLKNRPTIKQRVKQIRENVQNLFS